MLTCDGKNVTLDQPWSVPPDATSLVSIGKFQGRMLFIGNKFRDAGTAVQLYPPNCDSIVAENQMWRVESMNCGADISHRIPTPTPSQGESPGIWRVEPSWFNQFLNNRVWEGNGWGANAASISVNANGRLLAQDDALINGLSISRGHVLRGNQLENNARIQVQGSVRDVIIEQNTVRNVEQGVIVVASKDKGEGTLVTPPEGISVGENTFENVLEPVVKP